VLVSHKCLKQKSRLASRDKLPPMPPHARMSFGLQPRICMHTTRACVPLLA
jgi:hypothetical protein